MLAPFCSGLRFLTRSVGMANPNPNPSSGHVIVRNSRLHPQKPADRARAVPLSLLDATTAKFGLTSAIWLLEPPTIPRAQYSLVEHLRLTLSITLSPYPQWCGYLKSTLSIDGTNLPLDTSSFPPHAKRYGRVYVHYGTSSDPGVEFVECTSTATVDGLHSFQSAKRRPIWVRQGEEETLTQFVPSVGVVQALERNEEEERGLLKPIMAVQYTALACGGFVLAAKIAHPLADIAALTRFTRDWGRVSQAILSGQPLPLLDPIFEPQRLDACAAGDINADHADSSFMNDALELPLHRYDCWASPVQPPAPFPKDLALAGTPLPWQERDTKAPVSQCTIHFSRDQIEHLYRTANQETPRLKISKHDALLAHIWSCVVRARELEDDQGPVHCDLVLGTRPAFQLDDNFIGSPTMMLNIEMPASVVASVKSLTSIAERMRETISTVNDPQRLAAHLHSIAFEKSPQRIWQAFLGRRHILVTSWARAGIYDVHFGLGSRIRYADGVVPCVDGCVLIVDGPPADTGIAARAWSDNGVEVTIPLRCEDMERLPRDPLLLP